MTREPAAQSPGSSAQISPCQGGTFAPPSERSLEQLDGGTRRRWRSDVHVDHDGFRPGLAREILHHTDRNTRFQPMGGVAMAQNVEMDLSLDAGLPGCVTQTQAHNRLQSSSNPPLAAKSIGQKTSLLRQNLPGPNTLHSTPKSVIFYAKTRITLNTKFCVLSISYQAPTPPSSPTRPTITPNHPNKPQFRIRTVFPGLAAFLPHKTAITKHK
jgi:hypothetical protein